MKAIRQKANLIFVVVALAFGAAANGAALTEVTCAPQACCRGAVDAKDMPIDGHGFMRVAHNCTPTTPAPCCRLKPAQTKAHAILAPRPRLSKYHAVTIMPLSENLLPETLHVASRPAILEDERIRAPLVPIYLLTLTILC